MSQYLRSALAALALFALTPSAPAAAAEATPSEEIQSYYDVLYDVWRRADELGFAGRFERLEPVIRRTFNMGFITQFSVGRYWAGLSGEQQTTLVEAVTRLNAATYASRFDSFSGESLIVLDEKETKRGDILVLTHIIDSEGEPVEINYLMRKQDETWQVVDVHLDGVISELATRRSEFTSVMKREGFDGLLVAIDKIIAALGE